MTMSKEGRKAWTTMCPNGSQAVLSPNGVPGDRLYRQGEIIYEEKIANQFPSIFVPCADPKAGKVDAKPPVVQPPPPPEPKKTIEPIVRAEPVVEEKEEVKPPRDDPDGEEQAESKADDTKVTLKSKKTTKKKKSSKKS